MKAFIESEAMDGDMTLSKSNNLKRLLKEIKRLYLHVSYRKKNTNGWVIFIMRQDIQGMILHWLHLKKQKTV